MERKEEFSAMQPDATQYSDEEWLDATKREVLQSLRDWMHSAEPPESSDDPVIEKIYQIPLILDVTDHATKGEELREVVETVERMKVESTLEPFLRNVTQALGALPELDNPHSGSVTLTFQAEEDAFRHARLELKELWVKSLTEAMSKGWDILHLVRLNENPARTLILVDHIRRYLGHRGDYEVYYTKEAPAVAPLQEYLVVDAPAQVAQARMAIEFSSKTQRYIDDGRIFRAADHAKDIDRILGILRQWKGEKRFGFKPLFDFYQKWRKDHLAGAGDWDRIVTEVEELEGPLSLFMNGLPGNTVPHEQYVAQLAPLLNEGEVADLLRNAIALRQKRVDAFEHQVKNHLFRHIMPIGALNWYKTTGYSSPDAWARLFEGEAATRDQRKAHLTAILDRLKNDNYQMGLLRSYFEDEAKIYKQVFWQVKEGYVVLLENLSPSEETDVKITEPTVVEAFSCTFDKIWNSPLVDKELSEVKKVLLTLV